MTPERWSRVEEIFAGTEGKSPEEIRVYLNEQCGGDLDLRREVEGLLIYDTSNSSLISSMVEQGAQALADGERSISASERRIGTRLGAYRLVSLIGTGGMGAVYLAVRDDEQFEKKVAIKLVHQGHDSKFVLERFRQERQILAQLEHPNIARFLDGGITSDQVPYYVMEFIEGGEAVVAYCEKRGLPIAERLELFKSVCSAVQFAHKNLVVHRDLKPGNILVDAGAVPKLLDFGIAKVLSNEPRLTNVTMTAVRMLTPDYGSPEQVTGQPITTATDIYSLGAVLYELLTGLQAHNFKNYSTGEIERVICREDPAPPSHRLRTSESAEKQKLAEDLAGDLDAIILHAMRKEPDKRYPSVLALVDDIDRYLKGQPVEARRGTMRYRAGKFVRRNRLPLLAAAMVLVTVIGGVAATIYQARRAERRFQQARQFANNVLNDFDRRVASLPQSTELRQWMTSTVVEYLDNLSEQAGGDSQLQLELARGYLRTGNLQGAPSSPNLGQSIPALASYRKALRIYQQIHARNASDLAIVTGLCEAQTAVAQIETLTGGMKFARERYQEARTLGNSLVARSDARGHQCLAAVYAGMVQIEMAAANPRGAIPYVTSQLDEARKWASMAPGPEAGQQILRTEISQAAVRLDVGDAASAVELAARSMSAGERLFGKEVWEDSALKIQLHHILGDALGNPRQLNLGRKAEALEHYRAALAIAIRQLYRDANDARARRDVDISLRMIGFLTVDNEPLQALRQYEKAMEYIQLNLSKSPSNAEYVRDEADALLGIGYAHQSMKQYGEALTLIGKAVERQNHLKALSPEWRRFQREFQESYAALGDLHKALGREKESLANYEKALEVTVTLLWEQPTDALLLRDFADSNESLAAYYAWLAERRPAQRGEHLRQAVSFQQKSGETWREWTQKGGIPSPYSQSRLRQSAETLAAYQKKLGPN
ncbi:MAG: protein kinase [Bryobacterales bacterium]|nr:protein kinase [Bryobacterales bacterium]